MKVRLNFNNRGAAKKSVVVSMQFVPRVGETLVNGTWGECEVQKVVYTPESPEQDVVLELGPQSAPSGAEVAELMRSRPHGADRQFDATLVKIYPEADRQKGTVKIEVRIDKPDLRGALLGPWRDLKGVKTMCNLTDNGVFDFANQGPCGNRPGWFGAGVFTAQQNSLNFSQKVLVAFIISVNSEKDEGLAK